MVFRLSESESGPVSGSAFKGFDPDTDSDPDPDGFQSTLFSVSITRRQRETPKGESDEEPD